MDVITMLKNTGVLLAESVQQKIRDQISLECRKAERYQKQRDVSAAVNMLVYLKQSESDIFNLMHQYFGLNNIQEVSNLINEAKVSRQIRGVVDLLRGQGKNYTEAREFVESHDLEDKLQRDIRLLEMSPEKLLKEVEKNNK